MRKITPNITTNNPIRIVRTSNSLKNCDLENKSGECKTLKQSKNKIHINGRKIDSLTNPPILNIEL